MRKSIRIYLLGMFLVALIIVLGSSILLNTMLLERYYLDQSETTFQEISQEIESVLQGDDLIESRLFAIDRNNQITIEILNDQLEVIYTSHNMNSGVLEGEGVYNPVIPLPEIEAVEPNSEIIPPVAPPSLNPMPNMGNTPNPPNPTNPPNINQGSQTHRLISLNLVQLETSHIYTLIEESLEASAVLAYIRRTQEGFYIVITSPIQPIGKNINIMNRFYLISGGIGLLLGWLFIVKFSKQFSELIISISNIAKKMANLDFQEKIDYPYTDELGELSTSINFLSEQLEENIQALQEEIEFQKLLSRNASHELKTPIAIIKGYAEGLYYGITDSKEQEQQYLEVVIRECDRMDLLIKEMLTLSKLSLQDAEAYPMEVFSVVLLQEQIEQVFEPLMEQNGIEFQTEIHASAIYGNVELLVQSVYNFLSNAMKYGDGRKVSFAITEEEEEICISVYNTGTPIPKEEMQKIFNLFYIVDQARTRDKNAHGLGLSIVKSVAELHQGEVYCKNEREGVLFLLQIPKAKSN
ncbi:MAG: HAMP domain-containing sensor histidine kinase [Eubacteriales bacterium]